jgi:ketosteroid isomerase-like protein
MMTTSAAIHDLLRRWAEAERDGDAAALDKLATRDFQLVGPRGYLLDRDAWLDRFRKGRMEHHKLSIDDVKVRVYRDAAIATAIQDQTSSYEGGDASGRFRITVIAVREGEGDAALWYLGGIHVSAAPPA